jgi:23S rRNA (uracil1939-C5)-methyltransferase
LNSGAPRPNSIDCSNTWRSAKCSNIVEHERLQALPIDAVDDEGRGRALLVRHGVSWDIAVRGAVVGDVVDVKVERVFAARQLVQARRLHLIDAVGPLHTERSCPHPGPCPACPLHGIDDGFVAALKQQRVRTAFVDAGIDVDAVLAPVVVGDGVRQKVKLVAGGTAGALVLGHYVPHSHHVVEAAGCAHARDDLIDAVDAVRERLDEAELGPELVVAVIARAFVEGVAVVVVARGPCPIDVRALWPTQPLKRDDDDDEPTTVVGVAWRQQDETASSNAIVGGNIDDVAGSIHGTPLGFAVGSVEPVHVDSFCQADAAGAAALVAEAAAFVLAGVAPDDVVFDLYAGTGAFSRALLQGGAAHVVAVETFALSVESLARLPRTTAIGGRVEDALVDVQRLAPVAGVVDPPRKGLGPAVAAALIELPSLRRVAVVSCDVDAGAADVAALVRGGFVVERVVPVDLFPGSAEVEVLTLLRR